MLSFFFSDQEPDDSGMEMRDRNQKGKSSFPVTPEPSLAMQFTGVGAAKPLSLPLSSTTTTADYEHFSLLDSIAHGTDPVSQKPERISGMSGIALNGSFQPTELHVHMN